MPECGEGEVKFIMDLCQMMVFQLNLQAMSNLEVAVVRS